MKSPSISAFLFFSYPLISEAATRAFWRMEMGAFQGAFRMDPIMSPDAVSAHPHVFHGSSGLGLNANFEGMRKGCTTAAVKEDMSGYWVSALYFEHADGKVERVPEKFSRQTVYYFSYGPDTQAFPEGFEIVVGNPSRRAAEDPIFTKPRSYPVDNPQEQEELAKKSIGFLCLEYQDLGTFDRQVMFSREEMDLCTGGFQANIRTMSCSNGQPPKFKGDMSHLAYARGVLDGPCPDSHPIRFPTLLFETTYETGRYIGKPGKYKFGTGDDKGYGLHADFKSGWVRGQLQHALDTCLYTNGRIEECNAFTLNDQHACELEPPAAVAADRVVCEADLCNRGAAAHAEPRPAQAPPPQQRIAVGRQQEHAETPAPQVPVAPPQPTPEPVLPPTFVTHMVTVTEMITIETTELYTAEATPEPMKTWDFAHGRGHWHRRQHVHG